jgi:hypothetical protein
MSSRLLRSTAVPFTLVPIPASILTHALPGGTPA